MYIGHAKNNVTSLKPPFECSHKTSANDRLSLEWRVPTVDNRTIQHWHTYWHTYRHTYEAVEEKEKILNGTAGVFWEEEGLGQAQAAKLSCQFGVNPA